jgi:hypothetical protein
MPIRLRPSPPRRIPQKRGRCARGRPLRRCRRRRRRTPSRWAVPRRRSRVRAAPRRVRPQRSLMRACRTAAGAAGETAGAGLGRPAAAVRRPTRSRGRRSHRGNRPARCRKRARPAARRPVPGAARLRAAGRDDNRSRSCSTIHVLCTPDRGLPVGPVHPARGIPRGTRPADRRSQRSTPGMGVAGRLAVSHIESGRTLLDRLVGPSLSDGAGSEQGSHPCLDVISACRLWLTLMYRADTSTR